MLLDPNAPSVVPGRAEMQVQFRDTDTDILERFEGALLDLIADTDRSGPCRADIAPISKSEPALMDSAFQDLIEQAAERHAPPQFHVQVPRAVLGPQVERHDRVVVAPRPARLAERHLLGGRDARHQVAARPLLGVHDEASRPERHHGGAVHIRD